MYHLNTKLLKEKKACKEGYTTFKKAHGDKDVTWHELLESNDWDDFWWCIGEFHDQFNDSQNKDLRLLSADYAESVIYLFEKEFPEDNRPILAIEAARKFANGDITKEDLAAAGAAMAARDASVAAAGAASWAASRDTSRDASVAASVAAMAAWDAARAAARDASRDAMAAAMAARAAAGSAAGSAARDAARAAARAASRDASRDAMAAARAAAGSAGSAAWDAARKNQIEQLKVVLVKWESES